MTTILTGGVGRAEVERAVRELGLAGVRVRPSNDMDAAGMLRAGQADYFLGTCHTGAGASLGVLVALMGQPACHTFGRSVPTEEEINSVLEQGKRVLGFAVDQIDPVAARIARAIAARG